MFQVVLHHIVTKFWFKCPIHVSLHPIWYLMKNFWTTISKIWTALCFSYLGSLECLNSPLVLFDVVNIYMLNAGYCLSVCTWFSHTYCCAGTRLLNYPNLMLIVVFSYFINRFWLITICISLYFFLLSRINYKKPAASW